MENEKEKIAVHELKRRMNDVMDDYLSEDDHIFYRFLRARNLNVDLAEDMLRKHLEWRKKFDVKNIFDYEPHEVLQKYYPANFLGFTKTGETFRYCPTGPTDLKGMAQCVSSEEFLKHLVKIFEEDLATLKKQSKLTGKPIDKLVYIHSCKGLTLSKVTDRKLIHQMILTGQMFQDNYPETLKMIIAIKAPAVMGILYSILKSVISRQIMEKIRIFTDDNDDNCKNFLLVMIDAETLPAFLGGKKTDPDGNVLCNTFVNHGGVVPEKYYRKKRESFSSLPNVLKATVPRGAIHELSLEVEEKDSLLKWEFRVKSGDIKFGILYQSDSDNRTEVLPSQRTMPNEETETGVYKCQNPGTYFVIFDNTYSYLRSKEIFYKIQVMSPNYTT